MLVGLFYRVDYILITLPERLDAQKYQAPKISRKQHDHYCSNSVGHISPPFFYKQFYIECRAKELACGEVLLKWKIENGKWKISESLRSCFYSSFFKLDSFLSTASIIQLFKD